MNKKEFTITGIDCAHCASKVENKVAETIGIKNVSFNFISKILSFEVEEGQLLKEKSEEVKHIISSIEPGAAVSEKIIFTDSHKVFLLTTSTTESNFSYIIKKCQEINGVESVFSDFNSMSISFKIEESFNEDEIVTNIKNCINNITGTEVKEIANSVIHKNNVIKSGLSSLFTPSFIAGILFFTIGFIPFIKPFSIYVFVISYILIGSDIVIEAFKKIFRKNFFDENFLMTIATFGAFAVGEYSEAVGVLLFYKIGEFFQDRAVNNSRESISSLLKLKSDEAFEILPDGSTKSVSAELIKADTLLVVKPGSLIPVDSIVIEGSSNIDSSNITGESLPLFVEPGSSLLSGYINGTSLLKIKAVKNYNDSTVAKILALVEDSAGKKSKTENFITKFAKFYTPIVVFSALAVAFIPPVIFGDSFEKWIYRALIFLVVSCPCALVISIPLSFFTAIGRAAKSGILIKGSCYLEALNSVKTVVFDKTGTITEGKFKVSDIFPENNISEEELFEIGAYAEFYSTHPIAISIVNSFEKHINSELIQNYDEVSGMGIIATIKGNKIIAGNAKLLIQENISFNINKINTTSVLIARNGKYIGRIDVADSLKPDAVSAFKSLNSLGITTTILTGDNFISAEKTANALGVTKFYSNLLPNDKVEIFEKIQSAQDNKSKVAFVGDGVNDAPVIARADVGFAMGVKGSDASIEAADIVLMTDEVSKVTQAFKIAKSTRKVIIQNIIFSLSVKLGVLVLGILGISTMWEAVFADVGVAIIAILNAMRLIHKK